MEKNQLIPHLFRTEYTKITAVLCKLFGFEHIGVAEDIASDTFLAAHETWGLKGLPENPTAWLYAVAKNKARNYLRHEAVFQQKVAGELKRGTTETDIPEIDLSAQNIHDSQLQMMFAVCHPAIVAEAQIGLALRILCGFGIDEIATAFLSNKETIAKRLQRAKDKLRAEQIKIEFPGKSEIGKRLDNVLTTLYLLFNEGYYSSNHNTTLRKDLCVEAMRLTFLLTENENTNQPEVHALLALMSFQASRFDARMDDAGEMILYNDQDASRWDQALIQQGKDFLTRSASGPKLSRYHLEACIAYGHTNQTDTPEKWNNILQLYNHLLALEYSPMAALNRTYALSKAKGKAVALEEALKLNLDGYHLYHVLLSELYTGTDHAQALASLKTALDLAHSPADKKIIQQKIQALTTPAQS